MVQVRPREHAPSASCPFCRDVLQDTPDDPQETCSGCNAAYHFECLVDELNGTCAVLGCGTTRPATDPVSNSSCAGCKRGFVNDTPRTCRACGARHHLDCVRDRTCKRPGCDARVSTRERFRPRVVTRADREEEEERRDGRELLLMLASGAVGLWLAWDYVWLRDRRFVEPDTPTMVGTLLIVFAVFLLIRGEVRSGR